MAFGRSQRQSVITHSPMVVDTPLPRSNSTTKAQAPRLSTIERAEAPRLSTIQRARSQPDSIGISPDTGGRQSIRGQAESKGSPPTKTPGLNSTFQRLKSPPKNNGAARTNGPSPGFTGPSPGSWGSPPWSASPNVGPPYLNSSPEAIGKAPEGPVEGQWWLLEARNMREETRRIQGEAQKLKSTMTEMEETMKNFESMLESETQRVERLPSEVRAAIDTCNAMRPELKRSKELRAQQQATLNSLLEQYEELSQSICPLRQTNKGVCIAKFKQAFTERRELKWELRKVQTALKEAQQVAATTEVAARESRQFCSEAATFGSELAAVKRQNIDLEESRHQALKLVEAAKKGDRRSSATLRPKKGTKEYEAVATERAALQDEVKRLTAHIKWMKGAPMQEVPKAVVPQSPSNASQARMFSDVESSGCDDGTIDVLTPRSQMTAASREPSEANYRLNRDLQVRTVAFSDSSPTSTALTPRSQMTAASREPSEANLRLDRDLQSRLKDGSSEADGRAVGFSESSTSDRRASDMIRRQSMGKVGIFDSE